MWETGEAQKMRRHKLTRDYRRLTEREHVGETQGMGKLRFHEDILHAGREFEEVGVSILTPPQSRVPGPRNLHAARRIMMRMITLSFFSHSQYISASTSVRAPMRRTEGRVLGCLDV